MLRPVPFLALALVLATVPSAPLAAQAAPAPLATDRLSPVERRIAAYAQAHAEEAIAFLERTVNVNSGTNNTAGVREVGRLTAAVLDSLGFRTRWVAMPDSMRRAGHLFAERAPARGAPAGKRLLLIGHLDTVFEEDSPFQRFVRTGTTATGPGVNDMKGGNVVMLWALRALAAAGALEGTQIVAAFTGDEENPGTPVELARRDLVEAARRSDVALEFESGSRDATGDRGTIARRSATEWVLTVTGETGHSSGIFSEERGSGAIFEAARILDGFHAALAGQPNLTFNPGAIVGGTDVTYDDQVNRGTAFGKTNVVARTVVVHGDLRALSEEQQEAARRTMREIVARGNRPRTSATITFIDGYPPMAPTAGNRALLDVLNGVNRDLGLAEMPPLPPARRGAADISFVAKYVDGLAGLGAQGEGGHTADESIDLATLPKQIVRAALLMHRLTRGAPTP